MKHNSPVNGIDPRRVCRHLLEGRIEMPKLCLFNHDCRNCGYDQWLEETGKAQRSHLNTTVSTCRALAA